MLERIIEQLIAELNLPLKQINNTLTLLNNGSTIPFIARYRKEATGSMDEVLIYKIKELYEKFSEIEKRRNFVYNTILELGKLTEDIKFQIDSAKSLTEIEDIYLPFKPKRKTKASIAKEKGLDNLAVLLLKQTNCDILIEAKKYINPENGVLSVQEAIDGASDIIAEIVNEDSKLRKILRDIYSRKSIITSSVIKGKTEEGNNYQNYFQFSEQVLKSPSHRILAMFRGQNEGILKLTISPKEDEIYPVIFRNYIQNSTQSAQIVRKACQDAYKRLLHPSLENDIRNELKEKADAKAIEIFVENLEQLLMQAPLGQKRILAIDPGFRTGCKLVILNEYGQLLHNETIYPHPPKLELKQSLSKIENLVDSFKIDAIAIGNGTAGRETEMLIKKIRFKRNILAVMVNEAGASVYSASSVAREEFPDYDITVRGAVSIGRRLMDPLAELVKIEPKAIGVGQYQHDVDQKRLQQNLEETVVNCVNKVGVELNTASKELLSYVSGIGPVLAKNIISYKSENGPFQTREQLRNVPRFGDKAFEQAAGFLRIKNGLNPLDSTAVHPESYKIVDNILKKTTTTLTELLTEKNRDSKWLNQLNPEDFITEDAGLPTIKDIIQELAQPGRDPRQKFDFFEFENSVHTIEDLSEGMVLPGIITNITAFGAFVDIGIHESGLVHISQLSDTFIKDPNEVVKLNQKVMVKVLTLDLERKRIQLSMKGL